MRNKHDKMCQNAERTIAQVAKCKMEATEQRGSMQIRGVPEGDPGVSGMKATNKDVRKPILQIPYKTTDTWTPSHI